MNENNIDALVNSMSAYKKPHHGFHGFDTEKHRTGLSYEKVLSHWDIPIGARVLDVGAGLGEAAEFLHNLFDATVVQTDISHYPLALQRHDTQQHTQNELVTAGALHLPFANHSFDAVHMKDVFVHIEDKVTLLSEMRRLLKPDGTLLITTQKLNSVPYVLLLSADENGKKALRNQVAIFDSAGYADTVEHIIKTNMTFRGKKVTHISPPYFNTELDRLPNIAARFGFIQKHTPDFEQGWKPPKSEHDWHHDARRIFEFVAKPHATTK